MTTLLETLGSKQPDEPAVVEPGKSPLIVSHAQLRDNIQNIRTQLAYLGLPHQSAVSIALPNSYAFTTIFLATTWHRCIAAPLNPGYKLGEFNFYINDISSAMVVVPRDAFKADGPAVRSAREHGAAIAECYSDGPTVVLNVMDKGKLPESSKAELSDPEPDDIALVLHTSGTTGRPKAVPLTHINLMTSTANIIQTYQLEPTDRTMLIMPLFHVHGLLASFLSTLRAGGAAIIPARLGPSFWKDFVDHGATWYTATPTMHQVLVMFGKPNPSPEKLRFIRSCSSPLSPEAFKKIEETFGAPVLEAYAMTECSHQISSNPLPPADRRPGCVGVAQGVEICIIHNDTHEKLGVGEEGEICVRGKNVTKEYLNNPTATASAFTKDGFFRTGDQGKLDEKSYLTLTGRIKEFINKGGEKISPVEIDNLISQHEAVAEVVTFAFDDEMYGQEVGCAVKIKQGMKLDAVALKKWVRERVVAMKVPKQVWFPDEIPKTATGKVQRKAVAEAMTKK